MSKVGKTRFRYIAVRLHAPRPVPRHGFKEALQEATRSMKGTCQLTRYEYPNGVVQAESGNHRQVRATLERMRRMGGIEVRIETLRTSGTIRKLTRRVGFLENREPPKEKPRGPRGSPKRGPPRRQAHRGPGTRR